MSKCGLRHTKKVPNGLSRCHTKRRKGAARLPMYLFPKKKRIFNLYRPKEIMIIMIIVPNLVKWPYARNKILKKLNLRVTSWIFRC